LHQQAPKRMSRGLQPYDKGLRQSSGVQLGLSYHKEPGFGKNRQILPHKGQKCRLGPDFGQKDQKWPRGGKISRNRAKFWPGRGPKMPSFDEKVPVPRPFFGGVGGPEFRKFPEKIGKSENRTLRTQNRQKSAENGGPGRVPSTGPKFFLKPRLLCI